jgi:hypothetical protein
MTHLSIILSSLALSAGLSWSQTQWDRVRQMPSGSTATVHLRSGEVLKAKIDAAGVHGLRIVPKYGNFFDANRAEIVRVQRKSRAWGALWGAVIGFGAAAPFGAFAGPYIADYGNPSSSVRLRHAAGWGLFGAGIGAGIGALASMNRTIYRAPSVAKK